MTESTDQKVARLMQLATEYAHVYSFVGDDTMPLKKAELEAALRTELAVQGEPVAWGLLEKDGKPAQP